MPSKYRVTSCVQLTRDLFAIAKFWFISITIAIIFLRFFWHVRLLRVQREVWLTEWCHNNRQTDAACQIAWRQKMEIGFWRSYTSSVKRPNLFLFFFMDLRLSHWISHKYLLLILSLIDSSWKCLIQIISKLSSKYTTVSRSSVSVSLWLIALNF